MLIPSAFNHFAKIRFLATLLQSSTVSNSSWTRNNRSYPVQSNFKNMTEHFLMLILLGQYIEIKTVMECGDGTLRAGVKIPHPHLPLVLLKNME